MARARNIKPSFFDNDLLAEIDPLGRLLFIGLWCIADREGRIEYRPRKIKAQVLVYDDCDVIDLLECLREREFILIYSVVDKKYIQISNFAKHQNPHHKEVASIFPSPPEYTNSVCDGYFPLNEKIRSNIFDRDGRECNYCGSQDDLHIDHIEPVSKGGNSTEDNLQVLCRGCNVLKGNRKVNHDLSLDQGRVMLDLSLDQACVKENASYPPDSLLRNEESPLLNEDVLIEDLSTNVVVPSPKKTKPKKYVMPEDWITADDYGYITFMSEEAQKCYDYSTNKGTDDENTRQMLTGFYNHFTSKPDARVGWYRSFQNWHSRDNTQQHGGSGKSRPSLDETIRQVSDFRRGDGFKPFG